jgi:hypothetical protein
MIDRPSRGTAGQDWNLQEAMGLGNDKPRYNSIRVSCNDCTDITNSNTLNFKATIRDLVIQSGMDLGISLRRQDPELLSGIMAIVRHLLTEMSTIN